MSVYHETATELVPWNQSETMWYFKSASPLVYPPDGEHELQLLLRVAIVVQCGQAQSHLERILFNPQIAITNGRCLPDGRRLYRLAHPQHQKTEYREDDGTLYMEWASSTSLFGLAPPYCVETHAGFGACDQGIEEHPVTATLDWLCPPDDRRFIKNKVQPDWEKTRLYLKPWNKEWPLIAEIRIP